MVAQVVPFNLLNKIVKIKITIDLPGKLQGLSLSGGLPLKLQIVPFAQSQGVCGTKDRLKIE